MKSKKLVIVALFLTLLAITAPTTASACSRGGRARSYAVCTVEDCTKTGNHRHNGKYYCAHYENDGHDYHEEGYFDDYNWTGSHHGFGHHGW